MYNILTSHNDLHIVVLIQMTYNVEITKLIMHYGNTVLLINYLLKKFKVAFPRRWCQIPYIRTRREVQLAATSTSVRIVHTPRCIKLAC